MATAVTYDPTNYGNKPGDGPLRPGGVSVGSLPSSDKDLPSTLSPAAAKQMPALHICRDLESGPLCIASKGATYLPKAPGEGPGNYANRLARATFFNIFGHTAKGLAGFVFRKDPVLGDDVPVQIRGTETQPGHWENIDNAGTHGDVFLRELLQDALVAGHAAILVDFPDTGGTQTAADEFEIRPYWVPIKKDNILSWRTTNERGRTVLTQVVLKECTYEAAGVFLEKEVTRYRVLFRVPPDALSAPIVGWRLLEETDDKKVVEVGGGLYGNQVEIPIAEVVTSGRRSIFESDPPLLDIGILNLAHYRQWSDYDTSIHKTCVPIYAESGVQPEVDEAGNEKERVLGASNGVSFPDPNAKAYYVSHDGQALEQCKQSLDDLKSDCASLGLQMLAPQKRSAETLGAKQLDKSAGDSSLAVTARGLQDGAERALQFHARYLKLEDGGSVTVNRDFDALLMEAPVMTAYAALTDSGFPKDMAVRMLKQGGRLPDDADVDEITIEWEAAKAAADERKRIEAEDRAAAFQEGAAA